jgi:hypothetical protein
MTTCLSMSLTGVEYSIETNLKLHKLSTPFIS